MRCFVAVRPPVEALEHLAAASTRPVDPRWHVTLVFLGGVADPDAVAAALVEPVAAQPPLSLRLRGSGRFGSAVWVGVGGDLAALARLQRAVAQACGHVEDRPYRPHLTVARRGSPAALTSYEGPPWAVHEVELVRSVLGARAHHTVLARAPLSRG